MSHEGGDAECRQFMEIGQVHQLGDFAATDDADANDTYPACQPFTAPAVRPAMNCRCMAIKTMITGSVVIVNAAK